MFNWACFLNNSLIPKENRFKDKITNAEKFPEKIPGQEFDFIKKYDTIRTNYRNTIKELKTLRAYSSISALSHACERASLVVVNNAIRYWL